MNIEEALEGLVRATRSRDSSSMGSAMGLVTTTQPGNPGHRAVLLHFFSSFAHTADLAGVDAVTVSSALRHTSREGTFDVAQQVQLLDIHRTLLCRAIGAGLREKAIAFASAATECAALGEEDRVMLLALLLKERQLDQG